MSVRAAEAEALVENIQRKVLAKDLGRELHGLTEQLIEQGPSAVPYIERALSHTNRFVRDSFAATLARIISPEAQLLQLRVALNDESQEVARTAAVGLSERTLPRPLTPAECESLRLRIQHDTKPGAYVWGLIATHAPKEEQVQRGLVSALLERAVEYSQRKPLPPAIGHGTYATYEAHLLNRFGQASSKFDQAIVKSEASKLLTQYPGKKDAAHRWLLICMAYAGDTSVLGQVEEIVRDLAENSSIRAIALRAYTRAAKRNALPLLEEFENDTTPGPDPRQGPLKVVAHDELFWLRTGKK